MTSLLHQRLHGGRLQVGQFVGGDAEALSYLKDSGWTSRMVTPSPPVHLAGATAFFAIAIWGGIAVGQHSLVGGLVVAAVAAALATLDLLPALWTLSHRQYTESYLAARRRFGDGRTRLHPFLGLLALPALLGLSAAATASHQTSTTRVLWGLAGLAIGLGVGLLRVGRARRSTP